MQVEKHHAGMKEAVSQLHRPICGRGPVSRRAGARHLGHQPDIYIRFQQAGKDRGVGGSDLTCHWADKAKASRATCLGGKTEAGLEFVCMAPCGMIMANGNAISQPHRSSWEAGMSWVIQDKQSLINGAFWADQAKRGQSWAIMGQGFLLLVASGVTLSSGRQSGPCPIAKGPVERRSRPSMSESFESGRHTPQTMFDSRPAISTGENIRSVKRIPSSTAQRGQGIEEQAGRQVEGWHLSGRWQLVPIDRRREL